MNKDTLKVKCYSGHKYAERPLSFTWQGTEYEVAEIEGEWQQPGERCFQVRTKDNKKFRLCYNEARNEWSLSQLGQSPNLAKEQENAERHP